jgi:hypothetical protein
MAIPTTQCPPFLTTLNGWIALTVNLFLFHRGDADAAKLRTHGYAIPISFPNAPCLNFRAARSMQMTCLRICDGRRVRRRRRVKPWEHCFEIYRNHAWSVASVVDALNRAKQRVLKDLLSAECARREECRTATETALSMGNLSSSRLSLRLLRSSSDFLL